MHKSYAVSAFKKVNFIDICDKHYKRCNHKYIYKWTFYDGIKKFGHFLPYFTRSASTFAAWSLAFTLL